MESSLMQNTFAVGDYIVFGFLILISVLVGIFFACYGKGQKSTSYYFLGDRQLKVVPVTLSFVVSFQSSILILGIPAETYAYGMQYTWRGIGLAVAYLFASIVIVPIFHPMKLTSVYEYFPKRYGNNIVRFVAVAAGLMFFICYMGIVTFGTALALESAASIPFWVSVVIFISSSVLYTAVGGIKAVIWTDVFQAFVMLSGVLAILIKCSIQIGSVGQILELGRSRFNFFDFDPDPTKRHTFWTIVIGSIPQFMYIAFSQPGIQRINSTPTVKNAKQVYYMAIPIFLIGWVLVLFEGVIVYAYFFNKGCDPIAAGLVSNVNQIIPYTVMQLFQDLPGVPGLFIAALSAASLSTISSGLSSMAAITYEDIIKTCFVNIDEKQGTNLSKALVVVFGVTSIGIAFLLSNVAVPLGQIIHTFMGTLAGPLIGVFILSIFFYRTTTKGALTGMFCGFCFVLWIAVGQYFSGAVEKTPYLPLGPTYKCTNAKDFSVEDEMNSTLSDSYNLQQSRFMINITGNFITGSKQLFNNTGFTTRSSIIQNPEGQSKRANKTGLHVFYSISYMYFNMIGIIITVIVGIAVSLLTQSESAFKFDRRCVLPLSVLMPACLRNRLQKRKKNSREARNNVVENYELKGMAMDQEYE